MAVLTRGTFSLNLVIVQLGGELGEYDRQCTWELYTEPSEFLEDRRQYVGL